MIEKNTNYHQMSTPPANQQFYLTGYASPNMSGFSPADFLDAEETRPTELLLDPTGNGISTPYTTVVNNTLYRHLGEVREQNIPPSNIPPSWRKKLREFMTTKNEDLLSFMSKRLPESSPLHRVENFMKKYGRAEGIITNNNGNKDKFIDISGADRVLYLDDLETQLQEHGKSKYVEVIQQVKFMIDSYRETGEKIIQFENTLKSKLDLLDKAVTKLAAITNLGQNAAFPALIQSVQEYVNIIFEENQIEATYKELVQAYKKLFFLREALQFLWSLEGAQREPLCAICFNEPIQFALVPCGHTFCATCCKRQITACYICRVSVRERIKLFFG
jgi:hypothetical protein